MPRMRSRALAAGTRDPRSWRRLVASLLVMRWPRCGGRATARGSAADVPATVRQRHLAGQAMPPVSSACRSSTGQCTCTPGATRARSTRCWSSCSNLAPARRRCCGSAATAPTDLVADARRDPAGGVIILAHKGWLRTTRALAGASARQLIMGINLASGRPALAAAEARAILRGLAAAPHLTRSRSATSPTSTARSPGTGTGGGRRLSRPHGYSLELADSRVLALAGGAPAVPLAGPAFAERQLDGAASPRS